MSKPMPEDYPTKDDFDAELLEIHSGITWDFNRGSDTGGANVGRTFNVPKGRAVVEWDARETSCIRCKGPHLQYLAFADAGGLKVPKGVHVGVRFKSGHPAGSKGASYTGVITMVSVPTKEWYKAMLAILNKKEFDPDSI